MAERSPAQRSPARRSTAGTRPENRKRSSTVGNGQRQSSSTTHVGVGAILRRMVSRALQPKPRVDVEPREKEPRENRRRSSAPPRPRWNAPLFSWKEKLEQPIATAKRFGAIGLRGGLALAIAGGAVAVGRLIEAHVRRSAAFATQVIDVQGNERLDRDTVLKSATLAVGKNTFAVSPEEAERALRRNPWIASANVVRRLPDTYAITLEERQAVAVIALDQPYLVAGDAAVFKPWEQGDPEDLPIVTGVDQATFAADRVYRTSVLVNAVALLHDYRDAGLWKRAPIEEIHVESDEGLTLYVGESATAVRLHRPPFRKKLARLRRVFDQLAAKHAEASYVYLDNVRREDRVTVRLR